ncbi:DUF1496 domain-containing protein [Vibrio maerlii]|uniref:DUF1496 domain-containing protein n=1 Tax=Vibrio maerlii TaxID=2231648 RepID=UPI000E3EA2B0|nr:DUF1496 domain-containing protein [Vibrio maerlii]
MQYNHQEPALNASIKILTAATVLLTATSFSVTAKTYSVGSGAENKAIVVASGDMVKRVCYYDDKAYSEGAVIEVQTILLQCSSAHDFEQNGALKWNTLKSGEKQDD